ncbi:MAG: UDP-N-acetylglucosamine--N-acetylmuramyl-(pentapeptide) pyrophosphoryl-undecaprenol N-acetylglucosamine transferase, partial [Gemmatimonadales bacterium]|nr:UDP-N-acetylglucosamine--N-acetylmuramyl-(pentapeptide) pyrophosphoryl-undecaprenol N-acetylglucosamine transferase [Gemmatimonadales bacterium]
GGYASGPAVIAAWMLHVPRMIVEINVAPGLTSRLLGRFVGAVATSFAKTAGAFPPGKCYLVGSPLRREMLEGVGRAGVVKSDGPMTLFVFGG